MGAGEELGSAGVSGEGLTPCRAFKTVLGLLSLQTLHQTDLGKQGKEANPDSEVKSLQFGVRALPCCAPLAQALITPKHEQGKPRAARLLLCCLYPPQTLPWVLYGCWEQEGSCLPPNRAPKTPTFLSKQPNSGLSQKIPLLQLCFQLGKQHRVHGAEFPPSHTTGKEGNRTKK